MDQGVRVVLSMGIVTGGTVLALLFRHPAPPVGSPINEACRPLVLRGTTAPAPPEPDLTAVVAPPVPQASPAPPTVVAPPPRASLDSYEPAPLLARSYPESPRSSDSRGGSSIGIGLLGPSYEPPQERTHKIVDGDTLPALAKRYLGAAELAVDLYEANKYVLPDPEVLPIGVELRIPPRTSPLTSTTAPSASRPLVPVTPRPTRSR